MTRLSRPQAEVERLARIESVCTQFESECRQGRSDVAVYLGRAEPRDRPELLRELLLVAWWHQEKRGRPVDVAAYRQQFGSLAGVVEKAWQERSNHSAVEQTTCSLAASTVLPDGTATKTPERPISDELLLLAELGYTEVVELGAGGMGVVFRAKDKKLPRQVALKMIRPGVMSPGLLERFGTEAEALARLQHPHIVQVHGWEELSSRIPVLVLEYVPGETLEMRLTDRHLGAIESARLVAILAWAVQSAHAAGIVHRDLKPANVLMAPLVEGSADNVLGGFPKVSDFGLARVQAGEPGQTQSGTVLGTPNYMAPEQARGERLIGPAADVWALGVILYRALTGTLPFAGESVLETLERIKTANVPSLAERMPGVPAELEAVCLRCLEKDPSRRPSAAELAGLLERFTAVEAGSREGEQLEQGVGGRLKGRAAGFIPVVRTAGTNPAARQTRDDGHEADKETVAFSPEPVLSRRCLLGAVGLLLVAVAVVAGVLALTRPTKQPGDDTLAKEDEEVLPFPRREEANELKVRLHLRHVRIVVEDGEKKEAGVGAIGVDSFAASFGDGVRLVADLPEHACAYLVAFNADGEEQLLWPVDKNQEPDKSAVPPRARQAAFPPREGKLFYLNDDESGGLQVFVVLVSRQPLPSWSEWTKGLGKLPWQKHKPGKRVWVGDPNGISPRQRGEPEKRGTVGDWPGMPPLLPLARALHRRGVEQVEVLAFPVQAKEVGR